MLIDAAGVMAARGSLAEWCSDDPGVTAITAFGRAVQGGRGGLGDEWWWWGMRWLRNTACFADAAAATGAAAEMLCAFSNLRVSARLVHAEERSALRGEVWRIMEQGICSEDLKQRSVDERTSIVLLLLQVYVQQQRCDKDVEIDAPWHSCRPALRRNTPVGVD